METPVFHSKKKNPRNRTLVLTVLTVLIVVAVIIVLLPTFFGMFLTHAQAPARLPVQFPVTVNSRTKIILDDPQVNAYLASDASPLTASVGGFGNAFVHFLGWTLTTITNAPWYASIASVSGRVVTIAPGLRKEQVASVFGKALSWSSTEKSIFLTPAKNTPLPFPEGSFAPGTYLVGSSDTPSEVQAQVNKRFTEDVLNHYGTTTQKMVPLQEALTIASLIQRETIGTDDMRLVSGILWNRLFLGMKLQVDATVQYAKANDKNVNNWWPTVLPRDISRVSPYNTYLHAGLPPTPIANPSVAAIVAALNPVQTSCFYYFNDRSGNIHCTDTYAEHVSLLKKYYGQGK